ncbi:MAG: RNA polymerase sigma factor [Candidatus Solibacter usitatus]|nr:RNA polymerase sigma factor [Candidatus Solibacter usitatus]
MAWPWENVERWLASAEGEPPGSSAPPSSSVQTDILSVYDRYAPELLRLAFAATGSKDAAREALHDAFVALLASLRSGESIPSHREFLYQSLRDSLVLRTPREDSPHQARATASVSPDYDAPIRAADIRRRLRRIASPRELEMIQLRAQGLSYHEIAMLLQITPGTVASTLARVFRKIRKAFTEE